jgi:hypothetical protein
MGGGPGSTDPLVLLPVFSGITQDSQRLRFEPESPWAGVQIIRVQTVRRPSWVAWREIRIIEAGEGEG